MNHCVLEVEVTKAPTLRYTQDNKTPIAEMEVCFDGLRTDDSPGELKVVGWGNMAQDLQSRIRIGQRLVVEGRLRMNTIPRQDGTKEKRAELTLSKVNIISEKDSEEQDINHSSAPSKTFAPTRQSQKNVDSSKVDEEISWNSAPLVPDTDDIPF